MTQANERTATLSQLVAEEIRALMARRKVSGRDLSRQLGVSPSWISYRLSGKQPIDLNDMGLIAKALGVGVHDLLPPPEVAAAAKAPSAIPEWYRAADGRPTDQPVRHTRPRDTRPSGHPADPSSTRTARLPRGRGPNR